MGCHLSLILSLVLLTLLFLYLLTKLILPKVLLLISIFPIFDFFCISYLGSSIHLDGE
ncbi:hypothetical protein BDF14DRAFT_258987 [Spinellus fusiger]|nr:hypothetical protein BDF14DRAFT_258987 [Spinellus fusiger]